jgi:hypothetical protein
MVKTKDRRIWLATLLATACLLVACERRTHVAFEGGMTPIFVLSGSGKLASLVVYRPDFAEKAESPWDDNFVLWKIKPIGGDSNGAPLGKLRRIPYGVLPNGYEQVKPSVGPAPPLTEGEKYFYQVETRNAPGTAGYLEIKNSQTVATDGPHTCFGGEGKKWIRVPCPR